MERFLVTGGAGFIGSHLVERLLRDGHQVRVLDNFATGKPENLDAAAGGRDARSRSQRLEVIEGDLRDRRAVERATEGMAVVFHEGALASVQRSIADPALVNDVNVTGTLNVLLGARKSGVRRVVFAGSSSVYGDSPLLPKREDHRPLPISPYGVSKLMGEEYLRVFHTVYGLETVTLRYFNVFGPRQAADSEYAAVIPIFLSRLFAGREPVIYGDGRQSRDFTYIDNVVEANMLAARAPASRVAGRVMNAASGGRHTVLELCQKLIEHCGVSLRPVHAEPRPGDIRHSHADVSLAGKLMNYSPAVDFYTGLARTYAWFAGAANGAGAAGTMPASAKTDVSSR